MNRRTFLASGLGLPLAAGVSSAGDAKGAEAELGPDGSYQTTLPPADYTVVILPPLLMVESKGGPVDPQFKKVRNIPDQVPQHRDLGPDGGGECGQGRPRFRHETVMETSRPFTEALQ